MQGLLYIRLSILPLYTGISSGPGIMMGDTELDARLALVLGTPVLLTLNSSPRISLNETFNQIMMKRQVFLDHKVNGESPMTQV